MLGNVFFGCGNTPFVAANPVPGNFYPVDWTAGFAVNQNPYSPAQDPALMVWAPTSPYKGKATDGKDPGADVTTILSAVAGVVQTSPAPAPVPSPTPIAGDPELPRLTVNTTYPTSFSCTISVHIPDDFQAALNAAKPGCQVLLDPGTFTGNFVVPQNDGCTAGASPIVVRTVGADSLFPAAGSRMNPSYASKLAKIVTPNVAPAIFVHGGACKVWFSRVEVTGTPQGSGVDYNYGLIRVGDGEGTIAWQPHDIVLDRVYVHGNPVSVQHAIILNGAANALIDSYCSDVHWPGVESHCVASWAGAGPFKVTGNYLEAAGSNLMFGGADPVIAGLSPSDIEVRRNHFTKQLAWKGQGYAVKNLLELKHAKRILIEGNLFENSWADAQIGWAIIMQSGTDRPDLAPQTETRDVTFRLNWIRNANGAVDLTSNAYNGSGVPMNHVLFADNLMTNIGGEGTSTGVQLLNALSFVTVRHNTISRTTTAYGFPFSFDGQGASSITLANNILITATPYSGAFKTGGATGAAALAQFAGPSWSASGNLIVQDVIGRARSFPARCSRRISRAWASRPTSHSSPRRHSKAKARTGKIQGPTSRR
jgi:hypothetical protein